MIIGKTGVGKSTLLNSIFGEDLAKTGIGEPITKEFKKHTKDGFHLAIFDSPGIESGKENSLKSVCDEAEEIISKGIISGSIDEAIHCQVP